MMPIYEKQTVLLGTIQPKAGTYKEPLATENIEITDVTLSPFEPEKSVELDLITDAFGAKQEFPVGIKVKLQFTIALAGSGTAATAPYWGQLMRMCGFAQVLITTPPSVKYQPASGAFEMGSLVTYIGGNKHAMRDVRGTVSLEVKKLDFAKLKFDMTGVYVDPVSATIPNVSKKPRVTPPVLQAANTSLSLHGIVNLCLSNLSLDIGNEIQYHEYLNCTPTLNIVDRKPKGSVEFIYELLSTKDWFAAVKNNADGTLKFNYGAVAGNKIQIDAPKVCLLKPTIGADAGLRTLKMDMTPLASAGNDDFTITTM